MDEKKTEFIDRFVQVVSLHGLNLVNETKNAQGDIQGSSVDFLVPNQTSLVAANYFNHRLQQSCYAENSSNMELSRFEPVFQERIRKFIATKSDLLFQMKGREELRRGIDYGLDNNHEVLDLFSKVPPLEKFMEIPTHVKRWQLLKVINEGDIFLGEVTSKRPFGLFVKLTALEFSKNRDFSDTNIEALCRSVDLDDKNCHREYKDPIDAFMIGDYVRGVIISVNLEEERIAVSFKTSKLPEQHQHLHLGLLEDIDSDKKSHNDSDGKSYTECLINHVGLNNPRNIETLIDILGVDTNQCCSLLRSFQRCNYPEEEYFDVLRKKQSVKWSMESTAKGVELFKAGDVNTAMKYLEHALQIDGENVEALVARGALSANEGKYNTAVSDFRQALSINRDHKNAIKYLGQTLIEQGIQQEKDGNLAEASHCLNEALDLNPDQPSVKEQLEKVKQLLFLKRQKKKKNQKHESQDLKSKFSHVRELIEEEQIRKKMKKKKDKNKRKKKRVEKKCKKSQLKSRLRTSGSSSSESEVKSDDESIKNIVKTDSKQAKTLDFKSNNGQEQKLLHGGDSQESFIKNSSTIKSVDTELATRKRRGDRSNSSCSPLVSEENYTRTRNRLKSAVKAHGRKWSRSVSRGSSYSRSTSGEKSTGRSMRRTRDYSYSCKSLRRDTRSRSSRSSKHSRSRSSNERRSKRSRKYSCSLKSSHRNTRSCSSRGSSSDGLSKGSRNYSSRKSSRRDTRSHSSGGSSSDGLSKRSRNYSSRKSSRRDTRSHSGRRSKHSRSSSSSD